METAISIFWFRRDLRLDDNHGLFKALESQDKILPIFIFDTHIIDELPKDDARISFIHSKLIDIQTNLKKHNSSLLCIKGKPLDVFKDLVKKYTIKKVYTNKDYEPYALKRDQEISQFLLSKGIELLHFKDQVIFEEDEIVKNDGTPYTVFTPYKRKWLQEFSNPINFSLNDHHTNLFYKSNFIFPSLSELGFKKSTLTVKPYSLNQLENYKEERNFPSIDSTSYLSVHLRFGTVSIRKIINRIRDNETFLSELIWREFFMQILYHFPHVVHQNFRPKYNSISWKNNSSDFEKWKNGMTGYPMVDAGMRQLNKTGYMHNRVRMVVAGFLCKHLLINWQWGEAYFAEKLLDYELASNNGNWQWAAGTGCDAAPYFRVFNPTEQVKKFDAKFEYILKWVPELNSLEYPPPMVDHKQARLRAIEVYKKGLQNYTNT